MPIEPVVGTIYQGDALEVMKQWPDKYFDHCIVDPPFNMSKKNGLRWAFSSHITMQEDWDRFTREGYLSQNVIAPIS